MAKAGKISTLVLKVERPIHYQLVFRMAEGGGRVSRRARLTSPLLDRVMHGRKGTDVYFRSIEDRKAGGKLALDRFEMASLGVFLERQAEIRREIERHWDEILSYADSGMEVGRGSEVWKQTKVAGVEFWPRTVAAAEQVKFIKRKFGKKAKRLLEVEFDAADATSGFAVTMIPKWNDHLFRAVYRDGRCVDFQQDG